MSKNTQFYRNLLLLSAIWGVLVFFFLLSAYHSSQSKIKLELQDTVEQLNDTLTSLEISRNLNKELERMVKKYIGNVATTSSNNQEMLNEISNKIERLAAEYETKLSEPDIEYEKLRRRVRKNIQEMSNYLEFEIRRSAAVNGNEVIRRKGAQFLELTLENKRFIKSQTRILAGSPYVTILCLLQLVC